MLYTIIVLANERAIKYHNVKGLNKFCNFLDKKFVDGWVANCYNKTTRQFIMQIKRNNNEGASGL